jgi:NAD(P)-dependent dehydrogenase (short-subunit alcohol dehydrogenase family)
MTGSGSFVKDPEDEWQRVFDVCWGGVYNNTRAFLPALQNAPEARLVNMSSANGFFASVGPGMPHTSYSAAKFAVKGFTEALIEDLRVNAPNVQASVVMPGHVGTRILEHSVESGGRHVPEKMRKNLKQFTDLFAAMGLRPEQAAEIILSGIREGKWRILVGADAEAIIARVAGCGRPQALAVRARHIARSHNPKVVGSNPAPATNEVGHLVIALRALLFGSVPRGCHSRTKTIARAMYGSRKTLGFRS